MRFTQKLLAAAALFSLTAGAALAQGGGGFNIAAFQKFRDQHKYTFQLRTTVTGGFMEAERSPSTQIKPDQAKKLLAILGPLRSQPGLTQDQAKTAIQRIQRVLDQRQLSAVDRAIQASQRPRTGGFGGPPGGGPPGGGGGGFGGPPGGGRPGGARPGGGRPGGGFDLARMRDFNPFYADPKSPRYAQTKQRNDLIYAFLAARAAGKSAKLEMGRGMGRGAGGGRGMAGNMAHR